MARIQELLEGREERIDYNAIISRFPWILERNQYCILSPDSDGLLCGLFMSHFLGWQIKGFYDGKILVLENGTSANNCIFLDVEIFRKDIRSVGHHMVLYNSNNIPENWGNFDNCIQPNNIRGYDAYSKVLFKGREIKNFRLKYPFASIHFLLGIISSIKNIDIGKNAICPLLYTNGTFKNLLNHPQNCVDWIYFLSGDEEESPLNKIFYNNDYSMYDLMLALNDFFEKLVEINDGKTGSDKIVISNSKNEPQNLLKGDNGSYSIDAEEKAKSERFIYLLSTLTGWSYIPNKWQWSNLNMFRFKKANLKPSNARYNKLMLKEPLSLAMTSNLLIEYTIEQPDRLP